MQEAKINSPNSHTAAVVRLARNIALTIAVALFAISLAIIAATYGQDDIYLFTLGLTALLLSGVAGACAVAQHIHLATAIRTSEVHQDLVVQVENALGDVLAKLAELDRKFDTKLDEHSKLLKQIIQAEGAVLDAVGDDLAPRRRRTS